MKIIDIHNHFNHGSEYDSEMNELHLQDLPFLKSEYDNCGICAGAFSTFSSVMSDKDIYESNEFVLDLSQKNDWIYQWLVLDPRQEKLFKQIEENISNKKVLGIKIHSPYHNYDIEEYGDKIFSFANELKCFVLMHPDKMGKMPFFANKYPDMKLILAHLGSLEHISAIKNAKYGNIFTDTSGGASSLNNVVEYAVQQVGSEKIFFGTDTYSCGFQKGRIEYARIAEEDKENIFYKNAMKYFNMEK